MAWTSARFRLGDTPPGVAQAFVNPPNACRFQVPTIRLAPSRFGGITASSASSRLASLDTTSGGFGDVDR